MRGLNTGYGVRGTSFKLTSGSPGVPSCVANPGRQADHFMCIRQVLDTLAAFTCSGCIVNQLHGSFANITCQPTRQAAKGAKQRNILPADVVDDLVLIQYSQVLP